MFLIPSSSYSVRKTQNKGRGVFARKEIAPGKVIGDYLGTIVSDSTINNERKIKNEGLYHASIGGSYSVMPPIDNVGIHCINHSCEPNLAYVQYGNHVLYVSMRKIFPGEEFTVNYLIEPEFGERNYFICHCGAPTCKGTWYNHPGNIKKIDDKADLLSRSIHSQTVRAGAMHLPLSRYPESMSDRIEYDLFGSDKAPYHKCEDAILPSVREIRSVIRNTGQYLHFTHVHLLVRGVMGVDLVCQRYRRPSV